MTPWLALIAPVATGLVVFLVTWGSTKEKMASMSRQIEDVDKELSALKEQLAIIGRLDAMTSEIKGAVKRLHDRIDGLESTINNLDRSVAVLDERSGYTPVRGVPVYRPQAHPRKPAPSETSEPPKTKRKEDK